MTLTRNTALQQLSERTIPQLVIGLLYVEAMVLILKLPWRTLPTTSKDFN